MAPLRGGTPQVKAAALVGKSLGLKWTRSLRWRQWSPMSSVSGQGLITAPPPSGRIKFKPPGGKRKSKPHSSRQKSKPTPARLSAVHNTLDIIETMFSEAVDGIDARRA
jgi:hypothetical protein